MAKKEFHIPIYGGTLKVVTEREEFIEAVDDEDEDLELSVADCAGMTKVTHGEKGPVYLVGIFDHDLSTVVHEMGHVTIFIADHCGFRINEETSECFCYLIEELVRMCLPLVGLHAEPDPELDLGN